MTSYQEITQQIGDQWVAALNRASEAVDRMAEGIKESRGRVELPANETISKLTESFQEGMPKPTEIVEANFELTNRLLAAQRDLTLRLLAAASGAQEAPASEPAAQAAPKKAAAKKTAAS